MDPRIRRGGAAGNVGGYSSFPTDHNGGKAGSLQSRIKALESRNMNMELELLSQMIDEKHMVAQMDEDFMEREAAHVAAGGAPHVLEVGQVGEHSYVEPTAHSNEPVAPKRGVMSGGKWHIRPGAEELWRVSGEVESLSAEERKLAMDRSSEPHWKQQQRAPGDIAKEVKQDYYDDGEGGGTEKGTPTTGTKGRSCGTTAGAATPGTAGATGATAVESIGSAPSTRPCSMGVAVRAGRGVGAVGRRGGGMGRRAPATRRRTARSSGRGRWRWGGRGSRRHGSWRTGTGGRRALASIVTR